jgi:hypothetical protein
MFGICPGCALEILEVSIWIGEEPDGNLAVPVTVPVTAGKFGCASELSGPDVRSQSPLRRGWR